MSETVCNVYIKGTATSYVMNSELANTLDIKIKSVSMGGCVLNVTVIRHQSDQSHCMVPITMNTGS
jgi:hypothetical protein